jgi:hypothetical protein
MRVTLYPFGAVPLPSWTGAQSRSILCLAFVYKKTGVLFNLKLLVHLTAHIPHLAPCQPKMQPTGLLAVLGTLAAFVAQGSAKPTPTFPNLVARTSPQPCSQRYVCPTPRPYDPAQFPDTGDDPGSTRFKCRIGYSPGDPNFAFCIYEKVSNHS